MLFLMLYLSLSWCCCWKSLQFSPETQAVVLDVGSNDTVGHLQEEMTERTGLPSREQQLMFQGRHIAPGRLLSECGIGSESTLSLVLKGRGGAVMAPLDAAFEDLGILRRCLCRIHRFSPGVKGRELRDDGDRCVALGHWNLIATGRVNGLTLSPSLLRAACRADQADAVESLFFNFGGNCHGTDIGGWTLDNGAADEQGVTPLHIACHYSSLRVVQRLLQHGADPTRRAFGGRTPSAYACSPHRPFPDPQLANAVVLSKRDNDAAIRDLDRMIARHHVP